MERLFSSFLRLVLKYARETRSTAKRGDDVEKWLTLKEEWLEGLGLGEVQQIDQ
jgi:hypothetical protein